MLLTQEEFFYQVDQSLSFATDSILFETLKNLFVKEIGIDNLTDTPFVTQNFQRLFGSNKISNSNNITRMLSNIYQLDANKDIKLQD